LGSNGGWLQGSIGLAGLRSALRCDSKGCKASIGLGWGGAGMEREREEKSVCIINMRDRIEMGSVGRSVGQ